ncbi:MAG: hypothetical protein JXI32_07265, partial [Deltaproteobacteria bacterium]|nr:hypothetical protein [Deltaproteobacteria bacterium]
GNTHNTRTNSKAPARKTGAFVCQDSFHAARMGREITGRMRVPLPPGVFFSIRHCKTARNVIGDSHLRLSEEGTMLLYAG